MNDPMSVAQEIRELWSDYIEGQLDTQQEGRFNILLTQHREARDEYRSLMKMHTLLSCYLMPEPAYEDIDLASLVEQERQEELKNKQAKEEQEGKSNALVEGSPGFFGFLSGTIDRAMDSSTGFVLWVSLVVLIPLTLLFVVVNRSVEYVPMVAKITQQTPGNLWLNTTQGVLRAGSVLTEGQEYHLESGLAEIMFLSGARVVIHGPSTFVVKNSDLMQLDAGQCVTHVPQSASGFTIDANGARVVDLGTEFGIRIDAEKAETEVYVFDGKVHFSLKDDPKATKIELTENQGLRSSANSGTVALARVDNKQFVRSFDAEGILASFPIKNAGFEESNLAKRQGVGPDGIFRSVPIASWKVGNSSSPQSQVNQDIGYYRWTPKHGARDQSGVTEGNQACLLTLRKRGNRAYGDAWVYYPLGKVQAKDVGSTVRLSVDCLAKSKSDAKLILAFATKASATSSGSAVGNVGNCSDQEAWNQSQTLNASLAIPAQLVGMDLFIVLQVENRGPKTVEDIYLFDNLKFKID